MNEDLLRSLKTDLNYSMRRYYVDSFFRTEITRFPENSNVLDMGGKKSNKRGYFFIDKYNLNVKYANIAEQTEPDYLCDITQVPVEDGTFDGVILSEVLEHVPQPAAVLKEAARILKPGGTALICTPFMYHMHADPVDFGRYTDQWYNTNLEEMGFEVLDNQKQGGYFAILANLIKLGVHERYKSGWPRRRWQRSILYRFVFWFQGKALQWDAREGIRNNTILSGNTTGFGVIARKR